MLEIQKEEQAKVWGSFGLYENNRLKLPQEISQLLYDFIYHCMRTNVSRLSEWHTPPMEYLEKYPIWVANKAQ
jgi:hypothetical protein